MHATILYDSTYAHASVTSQSNPTTNEKLVAKSRAIFERVSRIRPIDLVYVRGHSGNLGNDHADRLAGLGATRSTNHPICSMVTSSRAPPPVHPLQVDHCCRCGRVFSGPSYARQLAGHEAYCKATGRLPAFIPCRAGCGKQFPWQTPRGSGKRTHHAPALAGSKPLNIPGHSPS